MSAAQKPQSNTQQRRKILVCGGRDFSDQHLLKATLDELNPTTVIHGAARGADTLAGEYASRNRIPCEVYPANWNRYGKRAGFLRNQQMLDEGHPDLVVAFPGGPGTRMMVKISKEQGYSVHVVSP